MNSSTLALSRNRAPLVKVPRVLLPFVFGVPRTSTDFPVPAIHLAVPPYLVNDELAGKLLALLGGGKTGPVVVVEKNNPLYA